MACPTLHGAEWSPVPEASLSPELPVEGYGEVSFAFGCYKWTLQLRRGEWLEISGNAFLEGGFLLVLLRRLGFDAGT